jgi:anaerobic selenocysteine-containing dehydrogenase
MSTPFIKKRLRALQQRGGALVVIDPRRTETAELADEHVPIVPGTDALLIAAMIRTVFELGLVERGGAAAHADGLDALEAAVAPFEPERVATVCGIDAETIRRLANSFGSASSAVCYGRMGTCTQPFGTLTTCLIDVLNVVTGNLDREGGAMFTTPAIDLAGMAALLGQRGSFARWRSRVSDLPEFNSELPVAALCEEIDTPGARQIRAMVIHAGNPVLSIPDGQRLDRALHKLDFIVAIDIYRNETTRHADIILPSSFGFEHDHYPLLAMGLSIRNATKIGRAIMAPPPGVRHDWQIMLELAKGLLARRGGLSKLGASLLGLLAGRGPRGLLALAVRIGPHGLRGRGLSWDRIAEAEHGIDLGPLEPRLPAVLQHDDKRIRLLPEPIACDLPRLEREMLPRDRGRRLTLISRRHLRCNNSWMHNAKRLLDGRDRCTVMIHPEDAAARGVQTGTAVRLRTEVGAVHVDAVVSDEMMPGVVSLPHGWGHDRDGAQLDVAASRPGASINDLTAAHTIDPVSGCSSFAIDVEVEPIATLG